MNFKEYLAEFIGTFFLVFFGCGSMIMADLYSNYDGGFIPLIWGLSVSAMIYCVGHISGAHFNPAVTISFFVTKHFPGIKVFGYITSQILGSLLASLIHLIIFSNDHSFGSTIVSVSTLSGFIIEFIISFALMFVIISVATDSEASNKFGGLAIGITVALGSFVTGPLTNASMNPARSLGPAIVSHNYNHLWLYILAPIIGAICGALSYELIRKPNLN